jgi:hypothetical protein
MGEGRKTGKKARFHPGQTLTVFDIRIKTSMRNEKCHREKPRILKRN